MFYDKYTELCRLIGKSPSAVAQDVGIYKSNVSVWKKGGKPSNATVRKIADYFSVSIDFLLNDVEKPTPVSDSVTLDPEDAQLLRRYHALSPEARGKLLGYLDALSSV